jgi:hypothetical protein
MEYRKRTLNTAFDEENPENVSLQEHHSPTTLWTMSIEEHNKYQYTDSFPFWRVIGKGLYYSILSCCRYLTNQI